MPNPPFDPREKSGDYITRSEFEAENFKIRDDFSKIVEELDDTLSGQQKINEEVLIAIETMREKALEALRTLDERLEWIERTGAKRSETLN
jgi:rubrerythrin